MVVYVQVVFGGDFGVFFWYQVDILWLDVIGEIDYFFCDGGFQVYVCLQQWVDGFDVFIMDVVVVFMQVQGDGVGIGFFGFQCGVDGIGIMGVVCIVQGGDVIDVDV